MNAAKRILFVSNYGSLGDLHPFIAMGRALQHAGYEVTLAVSAWAVPKVQAAGLRAVKAGLDYDLEDPAAMEPLVDALLDVRRGPLRVLREHVFPSLERWIEDTLPLARKADLIIGGCLGYFVPTLAELTNVPWAQGLTAPLLLWSTYDPPVLPQLPWLRSLQFMGPRGYALLYRLMFSVLEREAAPVYAARRARGLGNGAQLFQRAGRHSPYLNFALFSKFFAPPQPDWPDNLVQTGFLRYDGSGLGEERIDEGLERFLAAGPPPVLMTLGSGGSMFRPGVIYDRFAEAAKRIPGFRGVLLTGSHMAKSMIPRYSRPNLYVTGYAPFAELMPRCRAVVHQGGIGTTARALAAGVPSLIVSHANDQLDNGRRLAESGAGLTMNLRDLTARRLARALRRLDDDERIATHAARMADWLGSEDPEANAVRAIDRFFDGRQRVSPANGPRLGV